METQRKMTRAEAGRLGAIASRDIVAKQIADAKQRWADKNIRCLNCDTPIPYEKRKSNKFCNHSCAATFNHKLNPNRGRIEDGKRIRATHNVCKRCAKPTCNSKFCSTKCAYDTRNDKIYEIVINGNGSPRTIKRILYAENGRVCSICSTTTWQGQPVPLVLDHIDGNSGNSDFNNFRLVCGNCDMQLPTYKNKNKGKGRAKRRQRYAEGKSF